MYEFINMFRDPHAFAKLALLAGLPLVAAGCSQTAIRSKNVATAPSVNEGQAHIRGVSDPNAPFTLVRRPNLVPVSTAFGSFAGTQSAAVDAGSEAPCEASRLQVYEAAASIDGDLRIVRLALKNLGTEVCRLSGSPVIALQNEDGDAVANIAVRQTGMASLAGEVTPAAQTVARAGEAVHIVLRPRAEASFEIHWQSGDNCPAVSRFTVALPELASPGSAALSGAFTIHHSLNVCNGEIQVTALAASLT